MAKRHEVLQKIYSRLKRNPSEARKLFNFEKTVHADLELSWIEEKFQKKEIGPTSEFQIVIAKVKAGQTSDAHPHEKGSSSFITLGKKTGFDSPKNLFFRTGTLEFPSLKVKRLDEVKCEEETEKDIPSNVVHQFQNKSEKDAYILIVTHPIIYVKEGEEDIHFSF